MSCKNNANSIAAEFAKKQFAKDAHYFPPVSEVKARTTYAFTINPMIQNEGIIATYLDFQNVILKRLNTFGLVYKLRPEFSSSRRLHYHGYIYFPSYQEIANFYYLTMPEIRPMCTFCIKEIENTEDDEYWNWYLYTIKDRHLNKMFLSKLELPYKITNKTKALNKSCLSKTICL